MILLHRIDRADGAEEVYTDEVERHKVRRRLAQITECRTGEIQRRLARGERIVTAGAVYWQEKVEG
jgi:ribosomal protein L20A (L18A)